MVFDLSQIAGLGQYRSEPQPSRTLYYKDDKVFLVIHQNTIEVRCDAKLANHLETKYESVMESRYFGRGGIEIVLSNQFSQSEIADFIRLSYNLTA